MSVGSGDKPKTPPFVVHNGNDDMTNGNDSDSSTGRRSLGAIGGTRPKVKIKNGARNEVNGSSSDFPSSSKDEVGKNAEEKDDDEEEDEELTADLPKSFYNYCSDGEVNLGVSGAGQSNLSNEVAAALRQSEANVFGRERRNQQQVNGAGHGDEPPGSPEFLEMDFDPDDSANSESGDSGRGADEATYNNEEAERPSSAERGQTPPEEEDGAMSRPDSLQLEGSSGCCQQMLPKCGVTSAPLQSPANNDEAVLLMVRSKSLNSPLASISSENEDRLLTLGKTIMSGETSKSEDGLNVNREVCGQRLSSREALVFGLPSPELSVQNALSKLQALKGDEGWDAASEDGVEDSIEKTMVWTELEACKRQVSQVGVSACGATAVINVLQALEFPHSIEEVVAAVPTKLRMNDALVASYLFSRSIAGTNHSDLIGAVEKISNGNIVGRFFHMFPRRRCRILDWLASWIRKGAVAIATLNLQRGEVRPGQTIPDAWHHQMIFGVGSNGVYMTNPLESVPVKVLREQLCSPSELLVRRGDVVLRWRDDVNDLHLFREHEDQRWDDYNVLGQVVDVLRDEQTCHKGGSSAASSSTQNAHSSQQRQVKYHIRIPAVYKSGISMFVLTSNEAACSELKSCPELPTWVQSKYQPAPNVPLV